MSESARIVLVKPGDVLIFGNVSVDLDSPLIAAAMTQLKEVLGLAHVLLFEDDIDLAAVPSTPTPTTDASPPRPDLTNPLQGRPDEWCAKCGQARGVRDKDGVVHWLARWQAPWDCAHEFPAGKP